MRHISLYFLGPCHKFDPKSGKAFSAFSPESRSGRYLRGLLADMALTECKVSFHNVLPTAFFDAHGIERTPAARLLARPLASHYLWKTADIVVGLGGNVRAAFEDAKAQHILPRSDGRPIISFIAHPSYVLRRPRDEREAFAKDLRRLLASSLRIANKHPPVEEITE